MSFQDSEIILAIQKGENTVVLQKLYKTVLPKVKRYILNNSGTEDDAKDIFQDAVVALFRQVKLGKFDPTKEVAGFIYSASRNAWINKVKRDSRMERLGDFDHKYEDLDIEADIISKEKEDLLMAVMKEIGEECKKLLYLTVYENASMKEVCEKLGYKNENVAKTYNYRCKQKFVSLIKNNVYLMKIFKP